MCHEGIEQGGVVVGLRGVAIDEGADIAGEEGLLLLVDPVDGGAVGEIQGEAEGQLRDGGEEHGGVGHLIVGDVTEIGVFHPIVGHGADVECIAVGVDVEVDIAVEVAPSEEHGGQDGDKSCLFHS